MDRVRPMKYETIRGGGSSDDESLTEVSIGQDFLDCAGVVVQQLGATSTNGDASTFISRPNADNLAFTDKSAGTLRLKELLTSVLGVPGSHATVPDILHWVGPPGDGYASGAYCRVTLVGMLPSVSTWYTSTAMTARLFSTAFTYSGVLCSKKVHTLFVNNAAVRTLTETFNYTDGGSIFAPSITRTWA